MSRYIVFHQEASIETVKNKKQTAEVLRELNKLEKENKNV